MTQQIINTGVADKGNGDPIRTAFTKVNANFTELFNHISAGVVVDATAPINPSVGDLWWNSESGRMYVYYGTAWVDASPVDGAGISSTNQLVNGNKTVSLGTEGKLTLPAGATYEYLNAPLTGHGNGLARLDFSLATDGVSAQWLAASPSPAGSGYSVGNTFTFNATFLGIPGASVTIEVLSIGPGGSIDELGFTIPPLYPADIYRDSPINLQVGAESNRWTFGADSTLTLPGDLNVGNNSIREDGLYNDQFSIAAGAGKHVEISSDDGEQVWSFDTDGTLTLPAQGSLTDVDQITSAIINRTGANTDTAAIQEAWNIWYGNEMTYRAYLDEETQPGFPPRPWFNKPSWEGYPLLMDYLSAGGGGGGGGQLPPNPNLAPVAVSAINAYLMYKELVSDIDIVSGNKAFNFENTGELSLPGTLVFKDAANAKIVLKGTDSYGYVIEDGSLDKVWTFNANGSLTFPDATVQTTAATSYTLPTASTSVLGGVKLGDGFSTDADNKVTTNKLYSTNLTQPTQHYRLELDTNGVVVLPDGSIINGSTIRGVAGTGELNYAGITIGPNSNDAEKTWMWVDHANAYVSTNNAANTWTFGNDGQLTVPGAIRKDGGLYLNSGGDGVSSTVLVNGTAGSVVLRTDNGTSNKSLIFDVDGETSFPGRLNFADGSTYDNSTLTGAVDSDLALEVKHITAISDVAAAGSTTGTLIVDISENDDIIVVSPGWEINAGTEIAPQWMTVTGITFNPDNTRIEITVDGFVFEPGNEYTFRNPVPVSKVWTINSQNGTLIAPGNAILSNETADLGEGATYRDFSIELPTPDESNEKRWTFSNDGELTFPDATTSTGKDITIPVNESLTVNLPFNDGISGTTTFKINAAMIPSIKLPGGNGIIYAGTEDNANKWSLDSANKSLSFPDAGDGVYPKILYSIADNVTGMQLLTYDKSIKITAAQTSSWTFDNGGKLTLPADSSILTSETALNIATHSTETYTFNQAYWAALNGDNTRIFTPTFNAQYFSCTVTSNQSGAYTVAVTGTGNGFIPGNWFKIPGNELGGATPANDIQITIATVDGGGGILTTTITGTAVSKQWQFSAAGSLTLPDNSVIASYKPVTVIATLDTTQTISDSASAAFIQFVDTVDTANAYSTGTFTVPYTGYYQVNMSVYFSSAVALTSTSFLLIDTNLDFTKQVRIFDGNWSGSYLHYSTVISAAAGDAVRIAIRQVSGGDVDIISGSRLTIHRVSIS